MAKSGFLSYVDDKLADVFNSRPRDPSRDRARMLEHLDKCEEQFRNPPDKGRKFVTVRNDVVKFAPRYRFHDREAVYMPKDAFPNAVKTLRNEVVSGQHDHLGGGQAARAGKGWSPERKERFRATMAAKKRK